jgi:hypothetical protein
MRKSIFSSLVFGVLGWAVFATPLTFAAAHEGMKMECNEAGMSAMHADIQSMNDGEAKTAAMKEMKMAEEMMAKKDMKACMDHMHNAMEATEK